MLSGNKNVQYTRKNAQFRNGFWRCLRRALVASGCGIGRTTRKSAYFVRPCAVAKIGKYSVKKRAKNAKNGGVKIDIYGYLWAKMSPTPVSGRWGWGGWIFPSRLRRVGEGKSSRLSSFVFSLKQDTPSGGDRQHTPRGETHTQQQTGGGSDSTSTHGWAKKRAV